MGRPSIAVDGIGPLADALRAARLTAECRTTVVVARVASKAQPFESLTDDDFDQAWEQPMREAIRAFQGAHRADHARLIALVPTIAMSGAAGLGHAAATAEAIRVMVKSAARQWGADGMTVNCIALAPELFGIDPAAVGTVSIAPPALAGIGAIVDDIIPLIRLLAGVDAHHITGATLNADGGLWMAS